MKKRIEHTLLWIGLILALLIIYLTKFDKTESSSKLIYDLGQQIWFNISIAYLSSIIFYMVVVYIPERRKRKLFHFYIGMDINILHSRSWMLFMYLRDAAGMESEIPDTGNIQYEDVKKMMSVVNFDTVHKFNNERGTPTETFKSYLDKFSVKINIAINNSLLIPYDDAELTLLLLQLKNCSVVSGQRLHNYGNMFDELEICNFFTMLKELECYFDKHFAPQILPTKTKRSKFKIFNRTNKPNA